MFWGCRCALPRRIDEDTSFLLGCIVHSFTRQYAILSIDLKAKKLFVRLVIDVLRKISFFIMAFCHDESMAPPSPEVGAFFVFLWRHMVQEPFIL